MSINRPRLKQSRGTDEVEVMLHCNMMRDACLSAAFHDLKDDLPT